MSLQLDFFGFSKNEILGKPAIETIVPAIESTGRKLNKLVEDIYQDPDKYSININENIKKSGERVWIEWHNKALFDNEGNRIGHIAIGVDITQRKITEEALKESEEKLWSVLNATKESIYMYDQNGIITMSNTTGLERMNETAENELIGHHYSEFMDRDSAELRKLKLEEVFSTGEPLDYEEERSGRVFHHNYFPVFQHNKVSFVVTYSSDITENKKFEANLKESEDRFRTITEAMPALVLIIRASNSTITFVNEHLEKSFGFATGALTGKKLQNLFYFPSDFELLEKTLKADGGINNTEFKVKKADGTLFWIMTSVRMISFMNEPSYLIASIDITQTKNNQEELIRLNHTLNAHTKSSQAMMHSINEYAYLDDVCKIVIEDCGYKMVWIGYAQNDKKKTVKPIAFHGFDKGYIEKMNISWGNNDRGQGPTGTCIRTCKISRCTNMQTDPAFAPWREEAIKRDFASSVSIPLILNGESFGAMTIYANEPDAFSDKEIDLLSDLADDLAYGISYIRLEESERAATRAIKENEVKLKELIITKDKFFNIVAHDLKNPFTSLLGSSELLYDNINQMDKENIRELSMILYDSAKSGYAILQNLLDWSRSQTGMLKISPEKINLKHVINENIENLQLPAINKNIQLIYESQADDFSDCRQEHVNTVLRNLMSNALKFTRNGGTVAINAAIKGEQVVISVKDNGIGISKEKTAILFNLDSKNSMPGTANEQGTGLGLKLCKEFVEKMNGKIWVESIENKGSEFIFSIPSNNSVHS